MRSNPRSAGFLDNAWMTAGASVLVVVVLVALLLWKPKETSDDGAVIFYCAAGIRLPVETIIDEYRKEYGVEVVPNYGGSGELLGKLRTERDAPRADLYLAGDASYTEQARRLNLVVEAIPVARMKPVIAVRRGDDKDIRGVDDLLRDDVKVVLANPEFAAIGRIARKLLQEVGKWRGLEEHTRGLQGTVSMVGTVTEVANNLKLGAADAGIVWDATVKQYPELQEVPVALFENGVQDVTIAVVQGSTRPTSALRFARYLAARDKGLPVFKEMGWEPVDGDVWVERPQLVLFSGGVNWPAIEKTLEEFKKREGVDIDETYGGCGILVSKMKTIAGMGNLDSFPDAYFACDSSFVPPVEKQFHEPMDVSETRMVLLVEKGNPKNIKTLEDLARPGLRICMANEEHSALGALSKRLLEAAGLYDAVKKNVTYQAPSADLLVVQMQVRGPGGGTDVAIVYKANCSEMGKNLEIVSIDHPSAMAVQPFVVARTSKHKYLVERLRAAILSNISRERFESVGFQWRAGAD